MKKTVLIFGSVVGAIMCVNLFVMVNKMYGDPDFKANDFLGYTAMVLMFSLIFVGVRNYRNKESGGAISFAKAFKAGALIALISATLYVVIWLFYYYLFVPDFIDVYTKHVLKQFADKPAELATKTVEMAEFKQNYKNPVFVILITYMEVLPVALVVALVSALLLKRKPNDVREQIS